MRRSNPLATLIIILAIALSLIVVIKLIPLIKMLFLFVTGLTP